MILDRFNKNMPPRALALEDLYWHIQDSVADGTSEEMVEDEIENQTAHADYWFRASSVRSQ